MTSDLRPCPFCGGEADVHYFAHDDSVCTVMCSNPNCRASVSARSCGSMTTAHNRARKLWNRRSERTCRNASLDPECFKCSECGAEDYVDGGMVVWVDGGPQDASYCPHCGARVVEEADDDA